MGNRMIKESIRTSRSVNSLTDFQFRVWLYLITYVDDYGRGSADPELLKGLVFTRRKGVTEGQIEKALADLANTGMISLYEVDGESFFCFPNWHLHQRIQTKKSLFPAPPESTVSHGESPWITVNHRESPSEVETEVETEKETEGEANASCAEPDAASTPPVAFLPLNDGTEYPVSHKEYAEFVAIYPAVNVAQQLREMRGWLISNPAKRKTRSGILRFINRWLAKEQDKGESAVQRRQSDKYQAADDWAARMEEL